MLPAILTLALLTADCVCPTEPTDYPETIMINEIYPDPAEGEEEFIELKNTGTSAVDLTDWKITDASGKSYTLSGTITDYFVIYQSQSKIYLNNDGDTVKLWQPDGNLLEEVSYSGGEKGWKYIRRDEGWQWKRNADANDEENDDTDNNDTDDVDDSDEVDSNYDLSTEIIINELLPDPEGLDTEEEFIELYNIGEKAVNLLGWQLTDEKDYYKFSEDSLIEAKSYLVVYYPQTKISLNNSGETIYLIDPEDKIISGVTYPEAERGKSWSRFNEEWEWGEPTAEKENRNTDANDEENDDTDEVDIVSIKKARELEKDTEVIIEGIVLVEPGILGSQYFYLQDDEAGIQVYSSKKDFPTLKVGDYIQVKGKISEAYNEKRIIIAQQEDITIVETGKNVEPLYITEINEENEGMLVETNGEIIDINGNYLTLDNEITIYLKSEVGIDKSEFSAGDNVHVMGVASQYKDDYRLLPRYASDIEKVEQTSGNLIAKAGEKHALPAEGDEKKIIKILVVTIFGLLIALGFSLRHVIMKTWRKKEGK